MSQLRRFGSIAVMSVLVLLVSACGIGGDDDAEPTETTAPDVPAQIDPTPPDAPSTHEDTFVLVTPTSDASPEVPEQSGPDATIEDDPSTPERASPASVSPTPAGSPVPEVEDDEPATPSATVPDQDDDVETIGTPAATSAGSDGTSGASDLPDEDATPVDEATTVAAVNAIEVDSCDVVEVPPFAGSTASFLTSEDVNFRVGPGSDCASVLEGPLGPNVAVEVVGGPVVRTDDADGTLWVQVIVGDDTGWIAQDFLEAVEE